MASRRLRPFDVVLLAAAAALVLPAPLSVRDAAWVDHLTDLPLLALGGLFYGYLLARTRLPGLLAQPLLTALGFEAVTYVYTRVAPGAELSERVAWLGGRVAIWLQTVLSGGVSNDALVFALAMGCLAWLLGVATAWLLFRDDSPWLAAIGNALALLVNLSYAPTSLTSYLTWFLFASCLVLAVHQLGQRRQLWLRAGLPVEPRVGAAVVLGTVVITGALLSVAWALPDAGPNSAMASTWTRATAPWQSVERGFDRLFASLNGNDRTLRGLNFGRTLAPRGAFDLSDTSVLQVAGPRGLYLRATTADRYTGQAMTGSEATSTAVAANADLLPSEDLPAERSVTEAAVKVLASRSVVAFAPEAPLHLSVAAQLDTRATPEDVAAIRLDAPLQHDESYGLVSLVSTASIQQLRAAGEEYPDWVRQRYLQLPRELPRRVVDTAHEATLGSTSAYDKAAALEQYLRTDFTYSTHVAEVPPDRDWVDFFLFDSKEGYCDFFATALTTMLRTQGVPARVASGFAPGEYDASSGTSLVRENHAHTWVEVYFPRYGWITFEPSSIRAVPERLDLPDPTPAVAAEPSQAGLSDQNLSPDELNELRGLLNADGRDAAPAPLYRTAAGVALMTLATLALLGMIALGVFAIAWRRGLGGLARYQRPYAELLRVSRWFGRLDPAPSHTPYEVAEVLAARAPRADTAIRELTTAYVEGTYGQRPPTHDPWPSWSAIRHDLARSLFGDRVRRLARRFDRRR